MIAIAAVIGVGIAMFLAYLSTFDSLRRTQEAYYDRYRFADVFANAKRVPLDVLRECHDASRGVVAPHR